MVKLILRIYEIANSRNSITNQQVILSKEIKQLLQTIVLKGLKYRLLSNINISKRREESAVAFNEFCKRWWIMLRLMLR